MKTNYFGYIVGLEEDRIHIGKLREQRKYNHTSVYVRWKIFKMTPRLSLDVHMNFSIGQYVKVTADGNQAKDVSYLTDIILVKDILRLNSRRKRDTIKYTDLSQHKQKFLDLTMLTVDEFDRLIPVFEENFQERMRDWCVSGKKRTGRDYQVLRNCPLPTPEDRLLFILVFIKGNSAHLTYSNTNPWVPTLLIVLQTTLAPFEDEPYDSLKKLAQQLASQMQEIQENF